MTECATWISVDDRLPENTMCVLVTDGENMEITSCRDGEWEYHDGYGNHYELYGGITHWMPLPTPPLYLNKEREDTS